MEELNIAFHLISFLLALLAAALLLWFNKERKHSNRILALILILFAIQNLMLILLFSRLMLKVPFLLRAFAPTTLLIAPAAFIYIRSVLEEELKFRKFDWLLLIPALLTLINFIPYYLLPTAEKIIQLNNSFYNTVLSPDSGRGFLPSKIYYVLRVCWSTIFLFLGFRLIYFFGKRNTTEMLDKNKVLTTWLFTFNCFLTAILIVTMLKIFIPTIKNTQITVSDILLGAIILFVCLQLFMRPRILYGVFLPVPVIPLNNGIFQGDKIEMAEQPKSEPVLAEQIITHSIDPVTPSIEDAEQIRHKNIVETYFREKKPFLQTDYSLEQLAADTNIPRHVLSAFVNRQYGMGFREFLNRHRVNYMQENLEKNEWKQFTIEAIAAECGFSSRTTFIKNFKEITGLTPSEYIKNSRANGSNS